jgi:CopG family nickel-responsive transcriptional regulator
MHEVSTKTGVSRISVSLPEGLLGDLDSMVARRGFVSRSQAITEMINQQLAEYRSEVGHDIMAGTINLVYDYSVPGLHKQLSDIQHEYVAEVISTLNVTLENNQSLQVFLVQGPADKLKTISDRMIACRGVITGKLLMSTAVLPPVHTQRVEPACG